MILAFEEEVGGLKEEKDVDSNSVILALSRWISEELEPFRPDNLPCKGFGLGLG